MVDDGVRLAAVLHPVRWFVKYAASGVIRDLADHGYGGLEAAVVNFDLPAQDQSLATRERASVL